MSLAIPPMNVTQSVWERLSGDVSLFGGLTSPLLSWFGVAGLVLFFVWHVGRLTKNVGYIRQAYARVWPTLAELTSGRRHVEREWLSLRGQGEGGPSSRGSSPRPTRIDIDDVHTLDRALRAEPLFARAWAQFRTSYVLEQTSWFLEPRVFSTKASADYFPQEGLLATRLNVAFYHQLPSLMTGMGLLFTFLAILVGLSKLHAEATQIVGIQGLINGLAGKFLTSIVGLLCANAFVMLEKSIVFGLTADHQKFLTTLDDLFPRRTLEQMLENCSGVGAGRIGTQTAPAGVVAGQPGAADSLGPSIKALTAAVESLTKQRSVGIGHERLPTAADVARGVREGLSPPVHDLQHALRELSRSLDGFKAQQERTQRQLDELAGRPAVDLSHLNHALALEAPREARSSLRWLSRLRAKAAAHAAVSHDVY